MHYSDESGKYYILQNVAWGESPPETISEFSKSWTIGNGIDPKGYNVTDIEIINNTVEDIYL